MNAKEFETSLSSLNSLSMLREADQGATEILTRYENSLQEIAEYLYEKGTISGDELGLILSEK